MLFFFTCNGFCQVLIHLKQFYFESSWCHHNLWTSLFQNPLSVHLRTSHLGFLTKYATSMFRYAFQTSDKHSGFADKLSELMQLNKTTVFTHIKPLTYKGYFPKQLKCNWWRQKGLQTWILIFTWALSSQEALREGQYGKNCPACWILILTYTFLSQNKVMFSIFCI